MGRRGHGRRPRRGRILLGPNPKGEPVQRSRKTWAVEPLAVVPRWASVEEEPRGLAPVGAAKRSMTAKE